MARFASPVAACLALGPGPQPRHSPRRQRVDRAQAVGLRNGIAWNNTQPVHTSQHSTLFMVSILNHRNKAW
eukprot:CAMPEP_0114508928 /NCGR_PEP_ID=MMETSP0109-20121206/12906_1 /TAXON_ID=29199 /ORGANISM="Chlorarachnion reptans, Strain CCCM449" /LENGTH=70 /DNA_ID=CAMNT_0001687983 /DNA_START=16 /DNA_END=225 /DNA_ORIENTATION=-